MLRLDVRLLVSVRYTLGIQVLVQKESSLGFTLTCKWKLCLANRRFVKQEFSLGFVIACKCKSCSKT